MDPLWDSLPAVKEQRVFAIPYGTSSPGNAVSLLDAFEKTLRQLD